MSDKDNKNKRRRNIALALAASVVAVCCCIASVGTLLNNQAGDNGQQIEETAVPETTEQIAVLPEPTEEAIQTLEPTETAVPTNTPKPTSTPTPAPTVEPIVLEGTGDSVVDFEKASGPAIVAVSYNGDGNFILWSHSESGQVTLLINAIGNYSGTVPLDFSEDEHTNRLEVEGSGSWVITIKPLSAARSVTVPGSIAGNGDDIFMLAGVAPDTAVITNEGIGNFAVWTYGLFQDLAINEIGNYSGTIVLDADIQILVIHSDGSWSVTIEAG